MFTACVLCSVRAVRAVRQVVHAARAPPEAPSGAHRRAAARMRRLQEALLVHQQPEGTPLTSFVRYNRVTLVDYYEYMNVCTAY